MFSKTSLSRNSTRGALHELIRFHPLFLYPFTDWITWKAEKSYCSRIGNFRVSFMPMFRWLFVNEPVFIQWINCYYFYCSFISTWNLSIMRDVAVIMSKSLITVKDRFLLSFCLFGITAGQNLYMDMSRVKIGQVVK